MTVLGVLGTDDMPMAVVNHRCPRCARRVVERTPNPRYVVAPKAPPPKGLSQRRQAEVDPGYAARPRCAQCGGVMRDPTADGLCGTCAKEVA